MKNNKDFWIEFKSEIKNELTNIDKLEKELTDALKLKENNSKYRIIGSIIHDFYNCCERIFKKITVEINGGFEETEKWHKKLLYQMTIRIEDIRPRVITEELAAELDDYLSFRHAFRNIYGFELKGDRVKRLSKKFKGIAEKFDSEILNFLDKMEQK